MAKIFNQGNHNIQSTPCAENSPLPADLLEHQGRECPTEEELPCIEGRHKKIGYAANCDPMQAGKIVNDPTSPNRNVIYRYSNSLRACEQGMLDLFKDIIVQDEDGKVFPVPIIPGSQEKAVAVILQSHVKKDNTLVVDRPMLPMLALQAGSPIPARDRWVYHKALMRFPDAQGKSTLIKDELVKNDTIFGMTMGIPVDIDYTLYAWAKFKEDMDQIVMQVLTRFDPIAYIRLQNIPSLVKVTLNGVMNNIDYEPGDGNIRTVKYQFNLTVQSYICQPIVRNKTVLNVKTDFFNSVEPDKMNEVYGRQEIDSND